MIYFTMAELPNLEALRQAYRKLSVKLHPDKGGDQNAFKAMQNEYESLMKRAINTANTFADKQKEAGNWAPRYSWENEEALRDIIDKIINLSGITIEICGTWIWLTIQDWQRWDYLKSLSFKWSKAKKKAHYSPYRSKGKFKGRYSMKKIREMHGSQIIQTEERETIAA